MGIQVGDKELDKKADEACVTYRILSYPGPALPAEYTNLIIAPFLNTLRYGNDLFKIIDKDAYFNSYRKYIHMLMGRPLSLIRIAALDEDTMLGWSLSEPQVLHYVWVKKEVRRQGIAKALVPNDIKTITHVTNKGLNIWVNKMPWVKLNPFI